VSGLPLRPYQARILEAIRRSLRGEARGTGVGRINRPGVQAATGAGKTVMFGHLLTDPQWTDVPPDSRKLILVHRDELAQQARRTILGADPSLAADGGVGIVKAEIDEPDAKIVIGSVQTLTNPRRRERILDVGMVVVDEAHHSVSRTWREVIGHFGAWSGVPTTGWTATMSRADNGHLGDVWQELVASWSVIDGIRSGHLVDVRGLRVKVAGLDTSKIRQSAGDLQARELGSAMTDAGAPGQAVRAYAEHGEERPTVLFAPTVASAEEFAEAFNAAGVPTEVITGTTPLEVRGEIYERFRLGKTRILANAMVLTEGWDAPWCSCAIIARQTKSESLYIQMVGRILRLWPGKRDALVIDLVGASDDNRLASLADLSQTVKVAGEGIEDGESLGEADARAGDRLKPVRLGAVDEDRSLHVKAIDLLGQSKALWLTTHQGTMFVPSGDWIIFAWPTGRGTFTLGRIRSLPRKTKAIKIEGCEDLPLEFALSHAERLAIENDPTLSRKSASWRKSGEPSLAQKSYARQLRVPFRDGMTKAALSDEISIAIASAALDSR
jgi:superfamily II DNA or RNA helicase